MKHLHALSHVPLHEGRCRCEEQTATLAAVRKQAHDNMPSPNICKSGGRCMRLFFSLSEANCEGVVGLEICLKCCCKGMKLLGIFSHRLNIRLSAVCWLE